VGRTAAAAAHLTWAQVLSWRLRRHFLTVPAPAGGLTAVTSRLAGVHAQLQSSAELTLWARLEHLEAGELDRTLWRDRRLVKTWAMRGTLHLLPADEYPLWQAALSTFRNYEKASWTRYFGVSAEEMESLFRVLPEVLAGRALNRDELAHAVAARTGSPALGDRLRESWGAVLKPASYRGLLCLGPSGDRSTRFTLPRAWLGPWESREPADALQGITRRYLGAYGPATREELARWWGGVTAAQAGRLLAGLGDDVVVVDVEGEGRYLLAEDAAQAGQAEPPEGAVHLLPAFDQWVVTAPREQEAFLAAEHRPRVYRPQAWLSPVLLVGGRMEGVWAAAGSGSRRTVRVEPFRRLPAATLRRVERRAESLREFLGAS
jgi:hypothetical protein